MKKKVLFWIAPFIIICLILGIISAVCGDYSGHWVPFALLLYGLWIPTWFIIRLIVFEIKEAIWNKKHGYF